MSQMPTQPKDFVSSKRNLQVIRDRAESNGAKAERLEQGGICMVRYIWYTAVIRGRAQKGAEQPWIRREPQRLSKSINWVLTFIGNCFNPHKGFRYGLWKDQRDINVASAIPDLHWRKNSLLEALLDAIWSIRKINLLHYGLPPLPLARENRKKYYSSTNFID